ncbi:hypothetical protein PG988_001988 [Apiospora saccharicola]
MGMLHDIYAAVELGNFNWPFRNSHPTHPTLVHFPVAFLTTTYSSDVLHGAALRYGWLGASTLTDVARFGYASHAIGVLTALPAMTSGLAELWELYKAGGLNRRDKELTHTRSHRDVVDSSVKLGAVHGLLNAVALGVSGYALWTRWVGERGIALGKSVATVAAPGRLGFWLSLLTLPGLAISAALGGDLVYSKGVGVARVGNARDEKVRGYEEYKESKKFT